MELIPLALGALLLLIGAICLKKERHYKTWMILAILCLLAALGISLMRLLNGMTVSLPRR